MIVVIEEGFRMCLRDIQSLVFAGSDHQHLPARGPIISE